MTKLWDHDLNLSIHCYYVGELDTGLRASERILASEASESIKYNALQNLTFYTKSLSDYTNIKYYQLQSKLKQNGWTLFNPTLIDFNDNLLILIRSSNYTIDSNGRYIMLPEDNGVIKTNYIQLIMDKNGEVVEEKNVILENYNKTNYPVDGLEDLRIFRIKDKYYVSGTIRNCYPLNGTCRIAIADYDPNNATISNINVIDLNNNQHEKNWMPIVNDDCAKWVYHCNKDGKTSIISLEKDQFIESECNFSGAKSFRGGSQVIKVNNFYYAIIHEAVNIGSKRIYLHRFVEWNNDFIITKYSKSFSLKENRSIEFCSGMCHSEDKIYFTFGLKDKEAYLASLSLSDLNLIFKI